MKKIFTIGIALMISIIGFAQLPGKHATMHGKQRQPKHEQLASLQLQHRGEAVNLNELAEQQSAPKKVKMINNAAPTGDTIRLDFDHFAVMPEYSLELRTWFMSAMTEDEEWIVKFDFYGNSSGYAGVYDEMDMRYDFSYIYPPEYAPAVYYDKIVLKIEEKQTSCLKQIKLHADILGSDGNVYIVTVLHEIFSPKGNLTSVLDNAYLERDFDHFVLSGKNDQLDINLVVNKTNPISAWGPYEKQDFDMAKTRVTYQGVEQVIYQPEITIETQKYSDTQFAWSAVFSYYNQDTIKHTINITAPMPLATDTIEITCHNLYIDESWAEWLGWVQFYGQDDTYDIYAGYVGTFLHPGVYEGVDAMLYVTEIAHWYEVEALYTTLEVKHNPLSGIGYDVDITAYCADYNAYKIHMTYTVPEPTREVDVNFATSAVALYDPQTKKLQMENENDTYFCALNLVDKYMGDEFDSDDVNPAGIYLYGPGNARIEIGDISGKVYLQGDTTMIDAKLLGFDAVQYNVHMWYTVPEPTDTVDLFIGQAEFFNEIKKLGMYQLFGYTNDGKYTVTFGINSTVVPGTYGIDGTFGKMASPDGYYDLLGGGYTYVLEGNYMLEDFEVYTVEKGTVRVEMDGDQEIMVYASVICSNAICYNITMSTKYDKPHLAEDEPDEEVDRTYTDKDRVVILDETESWGRIYFDVEAADRSDVAAMYFFTEESDPEIIIPEGTYYFDYTEEPGTMLANPGITGEGYVIPSYYGRCDEHGSLSGSLWLLVAGSAEVKNVDGKLYIEVNALNSYDVPVHIVYDATGGTAVENVNAGQQNVRKALKNNQMVIVKDGAEYTVLGVKL